MLGLFIFAAYLESSTPGGVDDKSPAAIIAGFGIVVTLFFIFLGVILGFAGLFQANKKRLFPVTGAFLNLLFLLGVIGVIVLGLLKG